jgi:sterol desaturase/sphingolipid hydroxylase (fatty acid hydroxylase superfamily)
VYALAMNAGGSDARRPDPETLRQQRRQTFVNLAILLVLGTATTIAAMAGLVPVAVGRPAPGALVIEATGYVLLFDAYFYALHRVLHARLPFRWVHAVHHRSRVLTVWSTIAMHPVEFTLLGGFLPVTMCLWPVHLVSLVVIGLFLAGSITMAHSGRDPFPRWWARVPLLGIYLTPPIHEAHHLRLHCNYGATVTLFDRLFGTLEPREPSAGARPIPQ